MKVNTRLFGEIEVAEDRIITFTQGLMGFEEYTRYTLIYNSEKKGRIMWLQRLDEPQRPSGNRAGRVQSHRTHGKMPDLRL